MLDRVLRKVKRIMFWLYGIKLLFLMITYIILAFFGLNSFNYIEPSFRIIGLILQIFGIAIVIFGIRQTRQQFNYELYIDLFISGLKRCPIKDRSVFLESEGIQTGFPVGNVIMSTVLGLIKIVILNNNLS